MKNKLSLILLFFLSGLCAQAEVPNAALISTRNQEGTNDESSLSIVNLQSIQLVLTDQNQVQSVFVFEDQSTVVFENVNAIEFQHEAQSATVEHETPTDIESPSAIQMIVSPNPAKDLVRISGMKEDSRGTVFNVNGQRICDFNGLQTTIDVSQWTNGTYIIRIDNAIFKLIKQ
jgi:hypothetical protein